MRNISFAMRSVPRQFRVTRPGDIVHFQSILHLPLGFAFLFAAILARASIVLTVHDPTPHRWRLPRGLNWLERKMLEIAYRLSDKIIVHNSQGKDLMVRKFHIPETSVSVIPHGHYSGEVSQTAFPPSDCLRLLAFGSVRFGGTAGQAIVCNFDHCWPCPQCSRGEILGRMQETDSKQRWRDSVN